MRGGRWALILALLAMLVRPALAAQGPRLAVERGLLVVSGLPDVLARPEVRPHLSSGLTTTFVVRVSATDGRGAKASGGATVAVRWEPWDEVFQVVMAGAAGGAHRESLASPDRLAAWWRDLKLPVLAAGTLAADGSWQVKMAVQVVPFSESEREDTQRWFSESVGSGQRSNAEDASAAAREPAGAGMVLDLLVATSIRRRSLVSYDWTLTFRPSHGPEPRP
jgi:hypothetical protein